MNQDFKKWIIGRIAESFEHQEDAITQFLSTLKREPQKVKTHIADRLKKWCSEYATETRNVFIPSANDTDEIFNSLCKCFEAESEAIPAIV